MNNKSAPLILVIDTSGTTGTVALARVEEFVTVTVTEAELAGRTFASSLVSRISEVLHQGAAQLDELAAIAVVHGPGSFTGVRIGVAAAKALAEGGGKPLIAVSRLAVLCSLAKIDDQCCGLLDAGRGDFYAGFYRGTECVREQLMTREEVEASTADVTVVAAEALVAEQFTQSKSVHAFIQVSMPTAADAVSIAAARLRMGSYNDAAVLDGNYLRRTDAQIFAKPQARTIPAPAL